MSYNKIDNRNMKPFVYLFIAVVCVFISCEKSYVEPPEPLPDVSFKDDILPILVAHCESCHQTDKVFPGLILSAEMSYNQLLFDGINAPYVNTADPEASSLYFRLNLDMPQFGLLSSSDIAKVLKWIQEGAEND